MIADDDATIPKGNKFQSNRPNIFRPHIFVVMVRVVQKHRKFLWTLIDAIKKRFIKWDTMFGTQY